jgi:ribosome-associated toxin RatA of RatAB toxin-antitoxin module
MHRVDRSVLVPYSCAQMYALVRDVERYPRFLPWCSASQVQGVAAPAPGAGVPGTDDVIEARVDLSYLGVHSYFVTRNVHRFPYSIVLTLVDGPFRELRGSWNFHALGEHACKVTLELEYRFAAGLLGRVVAPVFERIANSLIDAFARRAQDLYGGDA